MLWKYFINITNSEEKKNVELYKYFCFYVENLHSFVGVILMKRMIRNMKTLFFATIIITTAKLASSQFNTTYVSTKTWMKRTFRSMVFFCRLWFIIWNTTLRRGNENEFKMSNVRFTFWNCHLNCLWVLNCYVHITM